MNAGIDGDTYTVLRDRLAAQGTELARRAGELNRARTAAFGSGELDLAGTGRLHTERGTLARDIVAVGDGLLLLGAHTAASDAERDVADVFTLYDRDLNPLPHDARPGLLDDPAFVREFTALHRYFRGARLERLRRVEGRLLAVFRTGEKADDLRVLRWSLGPAGETAFLDARGERDHVLPPSHDVAWIPATRDDHVPGRHPHVSLGGHAYVSTMGGTLTVKTADDTTTGEGVHSEPVDEPLQSLADADIAHAVVGHLLLIRVRPYKERTHRHLVLHTLTGTVARLDGIGQACLRLPGDEGIVFPGGYALGSGTVKTFGTTTPHEGSEGPEGPDFERVVRAPNGEDLLYVFHDRHEHRSHLLPYNLIRKEVAAPLTGAGHALFDDGTLLVLRAHTGEPGRVHPVQRWHTPYCADTHPTATAEGPLTRIGNPDLVRGISDCLAIARGTTGPEPTGEAYEALVADCVRAGDTHHWLGDPETGDLRTALDEVRATAQQVLREFETVRVLTRQAADATEEAAQDITRLVRLVRSEAPATAADWIGRLTELRRAQGRLITLKEMRYADTERIDTLAHEVEDDIAAAGRRAVAFLRGDDAFTAHHAEAARAEAEAAALTTVAETGPLRERLDDHATGLRTLSEVVTGLDIGDATVRTSILERIAAVLGAVNRARAVLTARRAELLDGEGRAEFAAETALFAQAVTGALAAADTPEHCDEHLARLLLQLENLESRFAEHDGHLAGIDARRTEVHEAFAARRQALQDARARRAERLADSAVRVLEAVTRRAATLADLDEVHTYFASDPMVARVRRTATELRALDDQVRAEELEGRLAAARQEAGRALRDRTDLFSDGGDTVRLGRHRFAVNKQSTELTLVPHGDTLAFAVTGTDYRNPVDAPAFAATRSCWTRTLPSESPEVYRSEHLAARLLATLGPEAPTGPDLAALVREAAAGAYDEGYERGVHDHDATLLLEAALRLRAHAGPLAHPAPARAAAQLFWTTTAPGAREQWTRRAVSLTRARDLFGAPAGLDGLRAELTEATGDPAAAAYLVEELAAEPAGFAVSAGARAFLDDFRKAAGDSPYEDDLAALTDPATRRQLVESWLGAYAHTREERPDDGVLAEATALELAPGLLRYEIDAPTATTVTGLLGSHPRTRGGSLDLRLDEFLGRTARFAAEDAPAFRAYQRDRTALVTAERTRLRLDEYRPRVMSSFVRNRLVDEVYLPLIGDNLAKQLGAAGDAKRTDSHGLLLLLSPPGYGKTTLIEYVADRLGLLLVKIDGPALGRTTTSLDPAEAPDAAARRELEKIAFALAAANNVLLYLDDIQHCSAELLQKFIPLCDATRTLDGHDLRGKRFALCMAGNPYTESGQRFQVPDMLANRADVWNLGDVLTGKEEAFALSFVENALTSHPVLAPLAGRDRADLELLTRLAADDPTARPDRLVHPYAPAELDPVLAVLRHLLTARETVLAVNTAYIASAARTDATRTEPPFRLQGSYRNMNKIAARIAPAMNAAELAAVVDDHYTAEAQTLTAEAETNLLKLAQLRGTLTGERAARWTEIVAAHARERMLGGSADDPLTRAVAALALLADRITDVETAITRATGRAYPAGEGPPPVRG
ncbi:MULTISPECIES: DNA repair ATPase [unclassified Streptomyces]|uniref:DNA repair ATPase n=1 Tax=unclassified Streptomyces TaxID=2593676 RepID=UPI0016603F74|nr:MULTISPECIES: DNA repair ATPase [unclassified Streptomyces]MBD0708264.1 DNA repair ATPase [Streptomyces sp. CBMA291]MBD0716503.1 DNA repair ATPase [Streptomyces sp. CBMA370]